MRRSEFINKSALGISSLALFPTALWSLNTSNSPFVRLKVNEHIRHGYYGAEYISNKVSNAPFFEIRVDHFLNDSGNMLLFDFDHIMKLRIGLTESQVFVQYENRQVEFDINESGILWEDAKSGIQIQVLNDREKNKNIHHALLVLKGTCSVSNIEVSSPFLVSPLKDNLVITSVGRSIVLKYPL